MAALFVFIPYCRTVCTYCDFNVYARRGWEFDAYARAVGQEIKSVADGLPKRELATSLALGGGTPSILNAGELEAIVNAAHEYFDFAPDAEWSLEANPGTVDLEKLKALRAMGFNRLSLGVQTFDDARLQEFNRDHSVQETYEAFEQARRAGFENINLDLIYGLPRQTVAEWRRTVERALEFQSEHLSLYGLQVEERTVLKKQIELGRVSAPDADLAAEMYEAAAEQMNAAGFEHYEISNWARRGFESRHNKTYWLNKPYLGFGAGAHSYWQGERYENLKQPTAYIKQLAKGESSVAARETIATEMEMAETMFLGLRLAEGVTWARFRERFGRDAREVYREPLEYLGKTEFLIMDEEGLRLTEAGMLISNQILWRFLPDE